MFQSNNIESLLALMYPLDKIVNIQETHRVNVSACIWHLSLGRCSKVVVKSKVKAYALMKSIKDLEDGFQGHGLHVAAALSRQL